MVNAYWHDLAFAIQEGPPDAWRLIVDTSLASPDDISEAGHETAVPGLRYVVRARSVVLLLR